LLFFIQLENAGRSNEGNTMKMLLERKSRFGGDCSLALDF